MRVLKVLKDLESDFLKKTMRVLKVLKAVESDFLKKNDEGPKGFKRFRIGLSKEKR